MEPNYSYSSAKEVAGDKSNVKLFCILSVPALDGKPNMISESDAKLFEEAEPVKVALCPRFPEGK